MFFCNSRTYWLHLHNVKMANEDPTHCYECAGKGKAMDYECETCDGEGNLKAVEKPKKK